MATRFRKSIKLGPGVRVNIGKKSASARLGGRGYGYTVSSTGRSTRSVGLPGTGVSWRKTASLSGSPRVRTKASTTRAEAPAPDRRAAERAIPKPGFFAPSFEKEYRRGLVAVATEYLEAAVAAFSRAAALDTGGRSISQWLFLGFAHTKLERYDEAIAALERVVRGTVALPDKPLAKYGAGLVIGLEVQVADRIIVELPFDASGACLSLAELYQEAGRHEEAAELLEGLGEAGLVEDVVTVALADLYTDLRRWDDVIRVTDGVENEDDLGVASLTFRAGACLETGLFDSALTCLQKALKSKARSSSLLNAARYQRARVHEARGHAGRARKEMETIFANDPDYADVRERLATMGTVG